LETLKGLLDATKAFTYELLAVLLPGAAVLAVIGHEYALVVPSETLAATAAAYVIGIVLQGVADYCLKRTWIAKRLGNDSAWKEAAAYALNVIRKTLAEVPECAALDICLTRVGAGRVVYDKFIALRDTARGLALATLVASVSIIVGNWTAITAGSVGYAVAKATGAIAVALAVFLALIQRYARFQPLALQAVYGQFLATQLNSKDHT
jgi:hypothetical protein